MICTHSVGIDSLKNDAIAFRGVMEQLAAIITPSAVRISTINDYSINYTDLGLCLITYSYFSTTNSGHDKRLERSN